MAPDPGEPKKMKKMNIIISNLKYLCLFIIDVYNWQSQKRVASNTPDIPTSGSDIVIISGSTKDEGSIEVGF